MAMNNAKNRSEEPRSFSAVMTTREKPQARSTGPTVRSGGRRPRPPHGGRGDAEQAEDDQKERPGVRGHRSALAELSQRRRADDDDGGWHAQPELSGPPAHGVEAGGAISASASACRFRTYRRA